MNPNNYYLSPNVPVQQESSSPFQSAVVGGTTSGLTTGGNPYAIAAGAGVGLITGLLDNRAKAKAQKRELEYKAQENKSKIQLQMGQDQQQGLQGIVEALRNSFIF